MERSKLTQQAYYQPSVVPVRMPGGRVTAYRRTAMGGSQDSACACWLLARWAEIPPEGRVLVLGAGDGRIAPAMAPEHPDACWTLVDSHAAAVQAAERTCQAAGLTDVRILLGEGAPQDEAGTFDVALVVQPKSRPAWERVVWAAGEAVKPGEAVYLAGANHCGIRTAAKYLGEQFGGAEVMGYRGKGRCVRAERPGDLVLPPEWSDPWQAGRAEVAGVELTWQSRPGVFSLGGLDEGTRRLIECLAELDAKPAPAVLDLGCGCGVAALAAGLMLAGARLTAVDVDCRAVAAARRTLTEGGFGEARVLAGDCIEPVASDTFDLILANPPLHQGRGAAINVAEQLLRDAAAVLADDGTMLVVANAHLRYDRVLRASFRHVTVLREDPRFIVWHATGPGHGSVRTQGGRPANPPRSRDSGTRRSPRPDGTESRRPPRRKRRRR